MYTLMHVNYNFHLSMQLVPSSAGLNPEMELNSISIILHDLKLHGSTWNADSCHLESPTPHILPKYEDRMSASYSAVISAAYSYGDSLAGGIYLCPVLVYNCTGGQDNLQSHSSSALLHLPLPLATDTTLRQPVYLSCHLPT